MTLKQFAELQDGLERGGLPRDLYYPAHEQVVIEEPAELLGGVVRWPQRYSPVRWAHRPKSRDSSIVIPSDDQREARFSEACVEFSRALFLRLLELNEQPKDQVSEEQRLLQSLASALLPFLGGGASEEPAEVQRQLQALADLLRQDPAADARQ